MKMMGIIAAVVFIAAVVCGCASVKVKPTYVNVPSGTEKWAIIEQYVKDNYGPLLPTSGNDVVSEWIPAGRDGNIEYRKQICITPVHILSHPATRLQIIVAIEKRKLDSSDTAWENCGSDESEQNKIAGELKAILN